MPTYLRYGLLTAALLIAYQLTCYVTKWEYIPGTEWGYYPLFLFGILFCIAQAPKAYGGTLTFWQGFGRV